jgi:hypothetical protein
MEFARVLDVMPFQDKRVLASSAVGSPPRHPAACFRPMFVGSDLFKNLSMTASEHSLGQVERELPPSLGSKAGPCECKVEGCLSCCQQTQWVSPGRSCAGVRGKAALPLLPSNSCN